MTTVTMTTVQLKEFAKMAVREYIYATGAINWHEMPELFTRKETAKILNESVRNVDRKINDKTLNYVLVGSRKRITKKSLMKLLNIR